MHELSITQNVLEIVLRHADSSAATQITDIYLVIGQLSSFVDEAVQFYWNIIAEGTIAQDATLHFERIQAQMLGQECGHDYQLSGSEFICPSCQSTNVTVTAGREFYVDSIEVETD